MIYTVFLNGCDDSTEFLVDIYLSELHILEQLRDLSKKTSRYDCMPVFNFKEGNHIEED